jgi:hypothetical protein
VKLKPIDDTCLLEATALLTRGFPERSAAFWQAGLERLMAYRDTTDCGPIGQLMMVGGAPAGVILTIPHRSPATAGDHHVVNLSSWYVEPRHRWLAPRMLQAVTADTSARYLDLSPSPAAIAINTRLGFRRVSDGVLLFFLPWTAVASRASARVLPFDEIPKLALAESEHSLLACHREQGCVVAALEAGDRFSPLIFYTTRRVGLTTARLLFAADRTLVTTHIAAIARFLLRHGIACLTLHAAQSERVPGGFMWRRSAPVHVKGNWETNLIDHTFTELVFLRL